MCVYITVLIITTCTSELLLRVYRELRLRENNSRIYVMRLVLLVNTYTRPPYNMDPEATSRTVISTRWWLGMMRRHIAGVAAGLDDYPLAVEKQTRGKETFGSEHAL